MRPSERPSRKESRSCEASTPATGIINFFLRRYSRSLCSTDVDVFALDSGLGVAGLAVGISVEFPTAVLLLSGADAIGPGEGRLRGDSKFISNTARKITPIQIRIELNILFGVGRCRILPHLEVVDGAMAGSWTAVDAEVHRGFGTARINKVTLLLFSTS